MYIIVCMFVFLRKVVLYYMEFGFKGLCFKLSFKELIGLRLDG